MALAVSLRFQFIDGKGGSSFTKIRVPNGFAISDYIEFGQFAAQEMADLSKGQIIKVSVCVALDLSTASLKSVAAATADAFEKSYWSFGTLLAGFRSKFKLPTWNELYNVAGTDQVDTSDITVAAFVIAYEAGIATTGGTVNFTDFRANQADALEISRAIFRKL